MAGLEPTPLDRTALERSAPGRSGPDPGRGVYGIAVAAELAGVDAQSLRLYERRGLL